MPVKLLDLPKKLIDAQSALNNALLELPGSGIRSVDYTTVVYSDRPNDGDHIVWYQRGTGQ